MGYKYSIHTCSYALSTYSVHLPLLLWGKTCVVVHLNIFFRQSVYTPFARYSVVFIVHFHIPAASLTPLGCAKDAMINVDPSPIPSHVTPQTPLPCDRKLYMA